MNFDLNLNKPVIALLGAGCMGTAIVRHIAAGKIILLGDISEKNLDKVATELRYGVYEVHTQIVDATDKVSVRDFANKAASLGPVKYFIDTAGASPARRVGTADEIAAAGAFLPGEKAGFITGIDLLIDGGVIATMNSGKYTLGE